MRLLRCDHNVVVFGHIYITTLKIPCMGNIIDCNTRLNQYIGLPYNRAISVNRGAIWTKSKELVYIVLIHLSFELQFDSVEIWLGNHTFLRVVLLWVLIYIQNEKSDYDILAYDWKKHYNHQNRIKNIISTPPTDASFIIQFFITTKWIL